MAKNWGTPAGVRVGQWFPDRRSLTLAYVHRPPQNGISGNGIEGADSIVVSGGYVDDEDHGTHLFYTGMGGNDRKSKRQVADQDPAASGNAGLGVSWRRELPVRVIRGPHKGSPFAPATGYVYSGLYLVTDSWVERGRDGFKVIRFRLDAVEGQVNLDIVSPGLFDVPNGAKSELDRLLALIASEAADLDRDLRIGSHGVTEDAQVRFAALELLARLRVDRHGSKPERHRFLQARAALDELAWDHDSLAEGDYDSRVRAAAEDRARQLAVRAGLPTTDLNRTFAARGVEQHDERATATAPFVTERVIEPPDLTALLDSPVYERQRARAGRAVLPAETAKRIVAVLMANDDRVSRAQLARLLGVAVGSVDGQVASLRRLLNVDGYDVIDVDADTQTIILSRSLLREQFGLGGQ